MTAWTTLPPLARAGFGTIAIGAVGDTLAHLTAPAPGTGFTLPQHAAHLGILLGMVLSLLGIVIEAVWPPQKGGSHANR